MRFKLHAMFVAGLLVGYAISPRTAVADFGITDTVKLGDVRNSLRQIAEDVRLIREHIIAVPATPTAPPAPRTPMPRERDAINTHPDLRMRETMCRSLGGTWLDERCR